MRWFWQRRRPVCPGSESAAVQGGIWGQWYEADKLADAGRISEAAELHARADLAEEEYLWGSVPNRTEYLAKKEREYRANYAESAV